MDEGRENRLSAGEARVLRAHCQHFSHLGWALFAQAAVPLLIQGGAILAVRLAAPRLLGNTLFLWILSALSVYGAGFPAFCLVIGDATAAPPVRPKTPLRPLRFGQVYLIGLALLYLSNYLTLFLLWLVGLLRGEAVVNPVESMQEYPVALNLLLACVIAPLAEEMMFRRLLLDRLRPYGDRFAVIASALCFGLFHGNLNQLFYAFALGLVFAYVALRTGCLWQTILLHAMVNFISAGLLPLMEAMGDQGEALLGVLVLGSIVLGVVFLIARKRDLWFGPGESGLTEGRKWRLFFENPGVLCFCLLAAVECAIYLTA